MSLFELYRITNRNDLRLPEALRLYTDAFPEDERRNDEDFLNILDSDDRFYCYAVSDKEGFVGLITFWKLSDFYYCEHFAIAPGSRNGGVGGKVLQQVFKEGFAPLLCEVEPPDDETALRRIGFYQRYGFVLHEDFDYLQPPYNAGKKSLPMQLMTFGFPEGKVKEVVNELKEVVYGFFEE